jgi:REP element-mobilizing transposase RayT
MVWGTLKRESMLSKAAAAKVSEYLYDYAQTKGVYMKINFVNADHVHAIIDLPTNLTIEDCAQMLKGSSSHWINENSLVGGRFAWGRGYGVFSVSHSLVSKVAAYVANQEEHHRHRTFAEELKMFVEKYGLQWRAEETVETV